MYDEIELMTYEQRVEYVTLKNALDGIMQESKLLISECENTINGDDIYLYSEASKIGDFFDNVFKKLKGLLLKMLDFAMGIINIILQAMNSVFALGIRVVFGKGSDKTTAGKDQEGTIKKVYANMYDHINDYPDSFKVLDKKSVGLGIGKIFNAQSFISGIIEKGKAGKFTDMTGLDEILDRGDLNLPEDEKHFNVLQSQYSIYTSFLESVYKDLLKTTFWTKDQDLASKLKDSTKRYDAIIDKMEASIQKDDVLYKTFSKVLQKEFNVIKDVSGDKDLFLDSKILPDYATFKVIKDMNFIEKAKGSIANYARTICASVEHIDKITSDAYINKYVSIGGDFTVTKSYYDGVVNPLKDALYKIGTTNKDPKITDASKYFNSIKAGDTIKGVDLFAKIEETHDIIGMGKALNEKIVEKDGKYVLDSNYQFEYSYVSEDVNREKILAYVKGKTATDPSIYESIGAPTTKAKADLIAAISAVNATIKASKANLEEVDKAEGSDDSKYSEKNMHSATPEDKKAVLKQIFAGVKKATDNVRKDITLITNTLLDVEKHIILCDAVNRNAYLVYSGIGLGYLLVRENAMYEMIAAMYNKMGTDTKEKNKKIKEDIEFKRNKMYTILSGLNG